MSDSEWWFILGLVVNLLEYMLLNMKNVFKYIFELTLASLANNSFDNDNNNNNKYVLVALDSA